MELEPPARRSITARMGATTVPQEGSQPAFTPDLEPTIALANQALVAVDRLAQVSILFLSFIF